MKKRRILLGVSSFFLSLTILLTRYIDKEGVEQFFHQFKFDGWFILKTLSMSIIVYLVASLVLKKTAKFNIKQSKKVWNNKKVLLISFISIFVTSLIFLLTYYPGSCMVDTLHLLFDPVGYSFQYPLLYSLFFSSMYNLFYDITGSMNVAFFLISLIQMIFMCGVLSYTIYWCHKIFKSNICTLFSILYFNVFTIFSNLNSANLRDSLFAAFILLLITIIYDIVNTKGKILENDKYAVKIIIIMGLLTIIRNNGIFTILILMAILFISYRKYAKYVLKISIGVLVLFMVPKLLPNEYKREGLFQESVAVPLQQLVYTMKYESLSDEDMEYLNEIMDTDAMIETYNPYCIDEIKWSLIFRRDYLNETKNKFIRVWLKNLPNHLGGYTKAYITNSYNLWSINKFNNWESRFLGIDLYDLTVYPYFTDLYNERVLPEQMHNSLRRFYDRTTKYVNNGSIFWIYVLLGLLLIYKNKKEYLLVLLPFMCIWLNLMIASPLSSAFRYMCAFGYALPFIITLVFVKRYDKEVPKEKAKRIKI